jgi:VWFA-related protein
MLPVYKETHMRAFQKLLIFVAAIGFSTSAAFAQRATQSSEGIPVSVTVTATGKDQSAPSTVPANSIVVRQDGKVAKILSWEPASGSKTGLDLAVLIDDSVTQKASLQLKDIGDFLRTVTPDARVAVAYASYGGVKFEQEFTTDHEKAAKAIRIPSSFPGTANGVYDSFAALIKKWPESQNRKVVLFISDGIDVTNGVDDSLPGQSMVLQRAIDAAERAGVVVYTIYASGAGRAVQNRFLVNNGQGSLARMASETGGDAFFEGTETPVSFKPFLEDVGKLLGQQYLLTFVATPGEKGRYARLQVSVEGGNVELIAPDHVYVAGGAK